MFDVVIMCDLLCLDAVSIFGLITYRNSACLCAFIQEWILL